MAFLKAVSHACVSKNFHMYLAQGPEPCKLTCQNITENVDSLKPPAGSNPASPANQGLVLRAISPLAGRTYLLWLAGPVGLDPRQWNLGFFVGFFFVEAAFHILVVLWTLFLPLLGRLGPGGFAR